MKNNYAIRWVIALKSEAIAIIEKYDMKSFDHHGLFQLFKNLDGTHWLVISGIGQINSASATTYLYKVSQAPPWCSWINIGIAGYKSNYGTIYLVDKVTRKSSGEDDFPGNLIKSKVMREKLITVDKPDTNYEENALIDMEASSFLDIATRLTCRELVIILKVVSDEPNSSIKKLTSQKITNLIKQNINTILEIASEAENLSQEEYERIKLPDFYFLIIKKFHFTETQKNQLKFLTRRCTSVFDEKRLLSKFHIFKNSAEVINYLNDKLEQNIINWSEK